MERVFHVYKELTFIHVWLKKNHFYVFIRSERRVLYSPDEVSGIYEFVCLKRWSYYGCWRTENRAHKMRKTASRIHQLFSGGFLSRSIYITMRNEECWCRPWAIPTVVYRMYFTDSIKRTTSQNSIVYLHDRELSGPRVDALFGLTVPYLHWTLFSPRTTLRSVA